MEESSRRAVEELSDLLWGQRSNEDVFKRWRQGFQFSSDEKSALLQLDGGPCSVIASVQAFVIKNLFFNYPRLNKDTLSESDQKMLLVVSMCDILKQASTNGQNNFIIVHINKKNNNNAATTFLSNVTTEMNDNINNNIKPQEDNTNNNNALINDSILNNNINISPVVVDSTATTTSTTATTSNISYSPLENANLNDNNNREMGTSKVNSSMKDFHTLLRTHLHNGEEGLQGAMQENFDFSSPFACLLFLYSVLFTKGLESLKSEMSEAGEPLIDPVHGHGTQCLTNLLLTGQAVSHIWDNFKELSGLRLTGISSQSQIGFLTLLEHLRYIEVGWYLKSPKYPIWLLASETHLSVFFSQDMVLLEDNHATAKRVFRQHDNEGRGFIACDQLGGVMNELNLFSDPQYVDLMLTRLDPEQLGIVTMETFLREFYPENNSVKKAKVFHYNGLCRSCSQNKVRYTEGEMTFSDRAELQMMADDTSAIRTCLMTRWPAVEVVWMGGVAPSLN